MIYLFISVEGVDRISIFLFWNILPAKVIILFLRSQQYVEASALLEGDGCREAWPNHWDGAQHIWPQGPPHHHQSNQYGLVYIKTSNQKGVDPKSSEKDWPSQHWQGSRTLYWRAGSQQSIKFTLFKAVFICTGKHSRKHCSLALERNTSSHTSPCCFIWGQKNLEYWT